ncbi:unnamed protein product, partial [Brenthis ino]
MANSPTSIETQIDSFLEQFKRSASKAMEERMEWPDGSSPGSMVKSRSSCFTLDSPSVVRNVILKLARREVAKSVGRRYGNGDVSAAQRSRTVLATCSTASSDFIHGKCIAILLP